MPAALLKRPLYLRSWPVLLMRPFLFVWLFLVASTAADAAVIGSWNLKHLGWADDKRDWDNTAKVISVMDFVALQEVHSLESLARLEAAVEKTTGEAWASLASHRAVGSQRYKEFYAFLWRERHVKYVDGATLFLDPDNHFIREPFSARFALTDGRFQWIAANVHVLWGDDKADRRREGLALDDYMRWLESVSPAVPVLLMGDFNMPPDDAGLAELNAAYRPANVKHKTTLSKADKRYASLYDNIWVSRRYPALPGHVIRFPELLGIPHALARKTISDHAPVYVFSP